MFTDRHIYRITFPNGITSNPMRFEDALERAGKFTGSNVQVCVNGQWIDLDRLEQ